MDASPPLASPLPAPRQLPDEMIEEIFLRVPPHEPKRLLRAALTRKHWARLFAGNSFRRRYRERHGTPPILGLLANLTGVSRFISNCGFRPAGGDRRGYRAKDARHGRVLLAGQEPDSFLAVWDPITDEQQELPTFRRPRPVHNWNAAVLCGAAAGSCDLVDCHPSPFRVVFFGHDAQELFAKVYSSESAGNALYFVFLNETRVLKYDLATGSMSVIALLPRDDGRRMVLMTMEDGVLGFAEVNLESTLTLWAMETGPAGGWAPSKSIDLRMHLSPHALTLAPDVVAFADIVGVIFLEAADGLYSFDLKSGKSVKVLHVPEQWPCTEIEKEQVTLEPPASINPFPDLPPGFPPPHFVSFTSPDQPSPPSRPMEPPPPQLPVEIVEEIVIRVPADHPAPLLRFALVCKPWARVMADRGFRRRYRKRHGKAPLLGIVANLTHTGGIARFVPTRGFCPARAERRGYRALDARHGRVLLNRVPGTDAPQGQDQEQALAVWDPTTDEQRQLPLLLRRRQVLNWNAAVLCGAPGDDCDHVDCHGGPFRVLFVGIDSKVIFSQVYSSESDSWGAATTAKLPGDHLDVELPGVLAWNAIHFVFLKGTQLLRYDLATQELAVIRLPLRPAYGPRIVLTTIEDSGLGFAELCFVTGALMLWSVDIGPVPNAGHWILSRAINLYAMLPADALSTFTPPRMVAFADGIGAIFLKTIDGLYCLDLKSDKVTKVSMTGGFYDIVPYVSYYTPGTAA
ncbi:hypothetical protein BAE44_0014547 [Dichanthelium oligosanthes]|uniref:F-box domain-containing protein n=1 Tax=Dichanthelium oligosanthes TaxID=888268 RepID=A0A1E5VHA9_9POAL|nr:hypothetical protein BAE44_0014547 [Dichanthelium oligosanthes]